MHLFARRKLVPRLAFALCAVALVTLCLFGAAVDIPAQAASANHIVISEIQTSGNGGADDELIELYNPTNASVVMSGWRLNRKTSSGSVENLVPNLNGTIPAHGFFLIAHPDYDGSVTEDVTYASSNSLASNNTVLLYSDNGITLIDKVGFGTAADFEGVAFPSNPASEGSIERKPGASDPTDGNGEDNDNNASDFDSRTTSEPQNSSSTIEPSNTPTSTATLTPSNTPAVSDTPTATATPSVTASQTSTATETPTATNTPTATSTPTNTHTPTLTATTAPDVIVINEVVTDPQQDWNDSTGGDGVQFNATPGTGAVSDIDEWIELFNAGTTAINLKSGTGWTLTITDSSAHTINFLSSTGTSVFYFSSGGSLTNFQPGEYLIIGNPPDSMNNDVYFALKNPAGTLMDEAEIGNVSGVGSSSDGAPDGVGDGDATTVNDEAIARAPNAADSGNHVADFDKQQATIAASNTLPSTATPTASATSTATHTPTSTATPTATATNFPARSIVINEVMWMGSGADSNDEWIELYNATGVALDLSGWTLTIDDGVLPEDTVISLSGTISAGGFFLLERTDDTTVSDIAADLIYTGSMSNDGRVLNLRDPTFTSIDTANGGGGAWPAGNADLHASMERIGATAPDGDGNWATNYGHVVNGHDKNGGALRATPRQPNSNLVPTPTPTAFARFTSVRLNEVLPNAGPAEWWIEYGLTHTPGEYIELYNVGSEPVDIGYWMLDDGPGGSDPYVIPPGWMIYPGDYWFMYTRGLGLSFNDGGDSARLLYPDGAVVDEVSWTTSMKDDRSISRNAAGTGGWEFDWQPSPGMSNRPHAVGSRLGRKPTPIVIGLRLARTFSDGAWITLIGKVTGPYPLFGSRVIYAQDESGSGLAVYLGRGTWPPMQAGQSIKAAGYLRTRNGERELYVRNPWLFSLGEVGPPQAPVAMRTGDIGEEAEGTLVAVSGTVVRLEANAFWIDDGTGPARVFFRSSLGFDRPKLRRGQVWSATGIVGEFTTRISRATGHRILVRFVTDVALVSGEGVTDDLTPTATSLADESATPTLLPEETETPTPARAP